MGINFFSTKNIVKTLTMAAIVIVLMVLCFMFYQHFYLEKSNVSTANVPSSIISNAQLTVFDENGKKNYIFNSSKTVHYEQQNRSVAQMPVVFFYQTNAPYWKLSADTATAFDGDKRVELQGNVHMHQDAGPNNHATTLDTTQMTLFPAKKVAQNNVLVTITEPGIKVQSVGFHANLKTNVVKLLSQTQGSFIPTNSKTD